MTSKGKNEGANTNKANSDHNAKGKKHRSNLLILHFISIASSLLKG